MKKFATTLILLAIFTAAQAQDAFTTGSSTEYSGELLEKYPSLDLMNSFTGVIPGIHQTENYGRTGVRFNALNCSLRMRAFSSYVYIVDGIVIPEKTELQINPEEIESVRVVSDILDKLRYGPEVATGAIYIKTLGGIKNGRQIKASVESGADIVDRFPEWVGDGVEYATLNNTARANAGYVTRFSDYAMQQFEKHDRLDPGFPNVDYKPLMFKNSRNYSKAHVLVRGGSETVRYSANIGWVNQGDIYAIGSKSNYNRFNAKMNLDIRINSRLDVNFSFIGIYGIRKSPLGKYGDTSESIEFPSVWTRARNTPPVEYPLNMGTDALTGKTVYPVSNAYPDHPYGSLLESGSYKETARTGITKVTLNYDLGFILKGLKSETQVSYNIFYLLRSGQGSDYIACNYDSEDWSSAGTTHKGESATEESEYKTLYLQSLQFYEKLKYEFQKDRHSLNAAFTYYRGNMAYNLNSSYHNQQNFILDGRYTYDNRFTAELVMNCAGTSSLKPGHRYGFFPAVGFSWVASSEEWAKDLDWLNWLKFRMQAGLTGNEIYGEQFYWQSRYVRSGEITFGPSSLNQWFGSNSYVTRATTLDRLGNENLKWEKLHEISAGFDAVFFKDFDFGATWYYTRRSGIVTDVSSILPKSYGATTMYGNYNVNDYTGLEFRAGWNGRSGDFRYGVSGFFLLPFSKYVKYCENVVYDNLKHEGHSTGMVLGYDCLGRFGSEEEIASSPKQNFDAEVKVGDLKYRDINGDNVVDSNDRMDIGDTSPKFVYALNLSFAWKNLDISIVGTGKAGFKTLLNNVYYWNGWGDGNYSAFVRDNLENGRYPRLSYVQSQNNFRNSQYWMVNGGFFKLQNVELGYTFPFRKGNKAGIENIRIFARGANLFTISGIKDCDPESLSSGVTDYPLFRTVTGGVKFSFNM